MSLLDYIGRMFFLWMFIFGMSVILHNTIGYRLEIKRALKNKRNET